MTCPVRAHQLTIEPNPQHVAAPRKLHIPSELVMRDRVGSTIGVAAGTHPTFGHAQPPRQLCGVYHFNSAGCCTNLCHEWRHRALMGNGVDRWFAFRSNLMQDCTRSLAAIGTNAG